MHSSNKANRYKPAKQRDSIDLHKLADDKPFNSARSVLKASSYRAESSPFPPFAMLILFVPAYPLFQHDDRGGDNSNNYPSTRRATNSECKGRAPIL